MKLGTADVLIRAKTKGFKKSIDQAETRVKSFGQNAVSSVASVTGAVSLMAAAFSTVSVGMDFKSQMASVRGVTRATDEEFAKLEAAARKMGETTAWTAKESAEALEYMGLAGWNVEKSIAGLPNMLDAATAAGTQLGQTSDILTDSLTAMGMEIEDMGRLTDVMVGTTTRANTDFLQMGEALREAAPYAASYGYEIEQAAAMIGILADNGIKGGHAGTVLKNSMINNSRAAKQLGTDSSDLIATLKAAGAAQWETNDYVAAYGKIAGGAILKLSKQIGEYEKLERALHGVSGETKKLADVKLDTLKGDVDILRSTLEGVKLAAYDALEDGLRKNVQSFTGYIKDNKDEIVGFAESLQTAAVSLGKIGKFAGGVFTEVIDGFNSLPDSLKEFGIVGVLIGGKKGVAAVTGFSYAIKDIKSGVSSLSSSLNGMFNLDKPTQSFTEIEERLHELTKLKEEYKDAGLIEYIMRGGQLWEKRLDADIQRAEIKLAKLRAAGMEPVKTTLKLPPRPVVKPVADKAKTKPTVDKVKPKAKPTVDKPDLKPQIDAFTELYEKTGIMTAGYYRIAVSEAQKERDALIRLTGEKEAAVSGYYKKLLEYNQKAESQGVVVDIEPVDLSYLQDEVNAVYLNLAETQGIYTQKTYDLEVQKLKRIRAEHGKLCTDKTILDEAYYQGLADLQQTYSNTDNIDLENLPEKHRLELITEAYREYGLTSKKTYSELIAAAQEEADRFVKLTGDKAAGLEIVNRVEKDRLDRMAELGIRTQETYDAEIKKALELRAEIEKLTGSKEEADNLFNKQVDEVNEDYTGTGVTMRAGTPIEEEEVRGDGWREGITDGFKAIRSQSITTAEIVSSSMVSAFDGVSEGFANWVSGAQSFEESFSSMATSVCADITQMIIKQQMLKLISGMFGGGLGYSAGEAATGNVWGRAKGGVHSGPGIAAYSNSIVDTPTYFPFAHGIGLMGEAGPEAIMPLTRTADGNLGVRSEVTENGPSAMQINIQVQNESDTEFKVAEQHTSQVGPDKFICNVVMKAMQKNKFGMRDVIRSV